MTLTISPVTGTLHWRLLAVTGEIRLHPCPATGHRDRVLIRRETERDADVIRAITTAAFAPRRPPGQIPPEARLIDELREWQPHFQVRVLSGYQPRLRGMFTCPVRVQAGQRGDFHRLV